MKNSKPDEKYLSEEGFLSLIIGVIFCVLVIFSRFMLGSSTLTTLSLMGVGYFFGSGVTYLKIATRK